MRTFGQAKIVVALLREWPSKNELIDLCNKGKKPKKISTSRVFNFTHTSTILIPKTLAFNQILKKFMNFRFQIV
jgi:hypothetical protein